jgi:hypothetical protein
VKLDWVDVGSDPISIPTAFACSGTGLNIISRFIEISKDALRGSGSVASRPKPDLLLRPRSLVSRAAEPIGLFSMHFYDRARYFPVTNTTIINHRNPPYLEANPLYTPSSTDMTNLFHFSLLWSAYRQWTASFTCDISPGTPLSVSPCVINSDF